MKKTVSFVLALTMLFCSFVLVSCSSNSKEKEFYELSFMYGNRYYYENFKDAYEKVVSTFDMFVLCRMWRTW